MQRETLGPCELRPNPRALFKLALGSSAAISTALAIPDAFAIIPTTLANHGFEGFCFWILRVAGLWLSCYLLWLAGFLCLLHLSGLLSGGIVVDSQGIKLWRLARKIEWDSIVACTISERKFFSRLFFIHPSVLQMQLHISKGDGKGVTVKQIPSFQFSPQEFASLFSIMARCTFGVQPSSVDVFLFKPEQLAKALTPANADGTVAPELMNRFLKELFESGRLKRILISAFIASSLIFILFQRSSCYYIFNTGNNFSRAGNYKQAIECYRQATTIYPAFAPGWDKLARAEYRSGKVKSAEEHWRKALFYKPDFVEAKLGLSAIYMRTGLVDKARPLIESAVRLSPTDWCALMNLAQLNILQGHIEQAIVILEKLQKQDTPRNHAICLLAQCMLRRGDFSAAEELLLKNESLSNDPFEGSFYKLICADLALSKGQADSARTYLDQLKKNTRSPDYQLQLARLRLLEGQTTQARELLQSVLKINPGNQWATLGLLKCALKDERKNEADKLLQSLRSQAPAASSETEQKPGILCMPGEGRTQTDGVLPETSVCLSAANDPGILAYAAQAFADAGDIQRARELAQQALSIDKNVLAANILNQTASPEPAAK